MREIPINWVAVLLVVVLAGGFVGGYFTGIMNSAGNFTLNITNSSSDAGSNYEDDSSTSSYYKTNTAKTTTTKNTATNTIVIDVTVRPISLVASNVACQRLLPISMCR